MAVVFFAAVPAWIRFVAPELLGLPPDFAYDASIDSIDNLFDEKTHEFSGEKKSVTTFRYEVSAQKEGILFLRNVFDVRTLTGKKILAVERLYGIDPWSGKHVSGHGDRDREGSLFAPRGLTPGQPFTYWHVNYDGPAQMRFAGEEEIFGLTVYRYETRYEGVRIDQTKNLGHLPGVPAARGVALEPYLQLWIEPVSGRLVKYADDTLAYYYDIKSGARLHPWNKFRNTLTRASVMKQVHLARREKLRTLWVGTMAPILFAVLGIVVLAALAVSRRRPPA